MLVTTSIQAALGFLVSVTLQKGDSSPKARLASSSTTHSRLSTMALRCKAWNGGVSLGTMTTAGTTIVSIGTRISFTHGQRIRVAGSHQLSIGVATCNMMDSLQTF